ncbi:LacI family DNA-binding transcriptional regulator [Defluviitalea phaphyphila]|uniref:LacI family DNA-binding transcriptional regulator n=1 Tax=Defluviitalea phaphyphila TaxID=1473580 RepID=UPI0007308D56|nr:LacI family DNA-binding transcriptional regulator [Defluviitalea phaphyphila]
MITIYDIAKKVGCSSATVSKALNNYPDVNPKTKEKIIKTAKEMGYIPNSQAQFLTKKKTWNIGVLFEVETDKGITHYFFAEILQSFKEYAEAAGYDLTFVSRKIGKDKLSFLEYVRRRRCDGVIITSFDYKNKQILELINSSIPVVVIDYNYSNVSGVFSKNYRGMELLTQYLIDLGHREIVYIHGTINDYVTGARVKGFKDTLRKNNIILNNNNLVEGMYYDRKTTQDKVFEILKRDHIPTAIIFSDDYAAVGGIKVIKELGYKIPKDISVAGFDGIELGEMVYPRLTTIKQNTKLIGKSAAKRLIEIIETKDFTKKDIYVDVELIKGKSCAKIIK